MRGTRGDESASESDVGAHMRSPMLSRGTRGAELAWKERAMKLPRLERTYT